MLSSSCPAYKFTQESEILKDIDQLLDDLADSCGITQGLALQLLIQYKWDSNKIMNALCEGELSDFIEDRQGCSGGGDSKECLICFEPPDKVLDTDCKTTFCESCLQEYISVQAMTTYCVTCPFPGCQVPLPMDLLKQVATLPAYRRIRKFIMKDYVLQTDNMMCCPNCDKVFQKLNSKLNFFEVACPDCFYVTCWDCEHEAHYPCSCEDSKTWRNRVDSLGESGLWIALNTKACPSCFSRIEKVDGCNHMTCRKPTCGHEFCWHCMCNWSDHSNCSSIKNYFAGNADTPDGERTNFNFCYNKANQHGEHVRTLRERYEEDLVTWVKGPRNPETAKKPETKDDVNMSEYLVTLKRAYIQLMENHRVLQQIFKFYYFFTRRNPQTGRYNEKTGETDTSHTLELFLYWQDQLVTLSETLDRILTLPSEGMCPTLYLYPQKHMKELRAATSSSIEFITQIVSTLLESSDLEDSVCMSSKIAVSLGTHYSAL